MTYRLIKKIQNKTTLALKSIKNSNTQQPYKTATFVPFSTIKQFECSLFSYVNHGVTYLCFSCFIYLTASSGGYGFTSNAFIFSLHNKEGLKPFKSTVKDPSKAIYRDSGCGPTFGGGHQIKIADNANSNTNSYTNFGSYYSVPSGVQDKSTILAGAYHFSPDEVEVFYLD